MDLVPVLKTEGHLGGQQVPVFSKYWNPLVVAIILGETKTRAIRQVAFQFKDPMVIGIETK